MRRIHDLGTDATPANVRCAWDSFSDGKNHRKNIKRYEKCLEENLNRVLRELDDESWQPSPYIEKRVFERKPRKLAKAPIEDHVLEAAAVRPYETSLYDYIAWQVPAVRPNMGQKALLRSIRNELFANTQQECMYYLSMDAHHYFPLMDHAILKRQISRKVKPGRLQRVLYKIVDSYMHGAPLGIKVSQIFGQLYLADFDRLAMRFFDIGMDQDKLALWTRKYIEARIVTASTPDDYADLCKGPAFLAEKFRRYVEDGLPHYSRFVDNIIIRHADKAVLGIVKVLAIMILARDYHVIVNRDYNVRPTWTGIRIVGYVFYHDRVMLGKRNKQDLCRHVARLFKQGKSEEEVRVAQASRFGYAKHADCIHLFKSIGMENSLGKIIKRRRIKAPFQGMVSTQKVKFSSICKMLLNVNGGGGGEPHTWNKKIYLVDYLIEDSKIEKTQVSVKVQDSNGQIRDVLQQQPGKVLAIRFKKIIKTEERTSESGEVYEHYEFEKLRDAQGNPTLVDAEYYSYTGSKILIDQALNDFSKEDLPSPTVVQQFQGKNGQTFFKFT